MTATPQVLIAQALGVPAGNVRVEPRARLMHQRNSLYDAWARSRHMVVKEYLTGQLARWEINDMAPNQRLRRYLARTLAWPKTECTGELGALAGLTFFPEE